MPGKCKKMNRLMNMCVDEAISTKDRQKLDDHLADCEKCRDEFNSLKYVISLAKEIEDKDPPADLKASVMDRIRRCVYEKNNTQGFFTKRHIWRMAPMAAAGIAIIFIAYIFSANGILTANRNYDMAAAEAAADNEMFADSAETTAAMTLQGDRYKSAEAVGNTYVFTLNIDSADTEEAKSEINTVINEIVQDTDEGSDTGNFTPAVSNEITLNATSDQYGSILKRIKEIFADYTVTEQDADENGMIRITINKK
jgi:hypothetical protein